MSLATWSTRSGQVDQQAGWIHTHIPCRSSRASSRSSAGRGGSCGTATWPQPRPVSQVRSGQVRSGMCCRTQEASCLPSHPTLRPTLPLPLPLTSGFMLRSNFFMLRCPVSDLANTKQVRSLQAQGQGQG